MSYIFEEMPEKLYIAYLGLAKTFLSQFQLDEPIISNDAKIYLNNPSDKKQISQAVARLKNNTNKTKETLILSNDKQVTISVH